MGLAMVTVKPYESGSETDSVTATDLVMVMAKPCELRSVKAMEADSI
jgi:hypothetical protein